MRAADVRIANIIAAGDHGRRLVSFGRVALVDVRSEFPTTQQGRTMAWRDRSLLRFVSQHHDAGLYPQQPQHADTFEDELARIRAVYDMHVAYGWGGIGYHTYGFPSGRLYLVGDYDTQRANVALRNHESIGHCSAGDFTTSPPSIATQLVAALATIAAWGYAGRLLEVNSHKHFAVASSPTECCGDTQDQWVPQLPRAIMAIATTL